MRICVYGASSEAISDFYKEEIYKLGKMLANRKIDIVYGGGAQGLMGAVARGCLLYTSSLGRNRSSKDLRTDRRFRQGRKSGGRITSLIPPADCARR